MADLHIKNPPMDESDLMGFLGKVRRNIILVSGESRVSQTGVTTPKVRAPVYYLAKNFP